MGGVGACDFMMPPMLLPVPPGRAGSEAKPRQLLPRDRGGSNTGSRLRGRNEFDVGWIESGGQAWLTGMEVDRWLRF